MQSTKQPKAVGYSRAQLNQFPASLLLRAELFILSYRCSTIALGHNTDPHQPIECEWKITRQILEVLAENKHQLPSSPSPRWSSVESICSRNW